MENTNLTTNETVNEMLGDKSFNYTYSSEVQKEIEKITKKYMPKEEDKLEQLRKLDASTTKHGTITSIAVGSGSSLILGAGMSMCMVGGGALFVPGILVGILGLVGVGIAFPLYASITKKQREKNAPLIMKLAEEISK